MSKFIKLHQDGKLCIVEKESICVIEPNQYGSLTSMVEDLIFISKMLLVGLKKEDLDMEILQKYM